MSRKVEACSAELSSLSETEWEMFNADVRDWMQQFPQAYVLIHADDGVIWGRVDDDGVKLRSATAQLNTTATWQQVRVFDAQQETLLWCDGDGLWHARRIRDQVPEATATYWYSLEETYLLWGNRYEGAGENFTTLWDASQGLTHIVPKTVTVVDEKPLKLRVRHYIQELDNGFRHIVISRLVDLVEKG